MKPPIALEQMLCAAVVVAVGFVGRKSNRYTLTGRTNALADSPEIDRILSEQQTEWQTDKRARKHPSSLVAAAVAVAANAARSTGTVRGAKVDGRRSSTSRTDLDRDVATID